MNLYPFQREGVEYALAYHYSINACEMGLGKTIMAIALMSKFKGNVMIVCPAYLKQNWKNEITKFLGPRQYQLFSYEQFTKNHQYYIQNDVLIFDEAHYLKNMGAKRTKAAHKHVAVHKPKYLYLLSGTPIKNRVAEFYSLLKLCSYNPKKTSGLPITKSYTIFAEALSYAQEFRLPYGGKAVKYTGLRNKPLLLKYLKGKYFRRTAKDELNLPAITTSSVFCDTDRGLESDLAADFEEGGTSHLSTAKARMAESKAADTAKAALDVLTQTECPVLIFSDHVDAAYRISEPLQEMGHKTRVITGSTPVEQRHGIVQLFQKKDLDVLICTIGSMSTGWTLTATNRIIFNDLSWCPADNSQALARIHRIGQERPCFVTYMVSSGVDEQINKTLTEKMKVLEDAL